MSKINLYKFRYKTELDPTGTYYVGVMAQEVQAVRPDCVFTGPDGYLRVNYQRLGAPFMKWDDWVRLTGRSGE
jgi:hypothetical protein